jgi:hypothetical protein
MHGKIYFETVTELAEFLKEFTGSTAIFKAGKCLDGTWELEFTGGC